MMTDEEIADYAHIKVEDVAKLRERAPSHIPVIEKMRDFEREWNQYLVGTGPKPTWALIDEDLGRFR